MSRLANGLWLRSAIALVAVAVTLPAVAHDERADKCGTATLNGLYVFSASGFTMPAGAPLPKAVTEFIRFNGDGTLDVLASTHSINGVVARSVPGTGVYSVDDACTGTLQFNGGPGFDLFVASRGGSLWMIQTDQNNVLEGRVVRISP